MNRLARACLLLLLMPLAGCVEETPERARISSARPVQSATGGSLDIVQQLQLSPPMLGALEAGIPLSLVYDISGCPGARRQTARIELRFAALTRRYELRLGEDERRYFSRRSAMLAALDRVRLPLASAIGGECPGTVRVGLDLASLPTPLRLPALLRPADWRLLSPEQTWTGGAG